MKQIIKVKWTMIVFFSANIIFSSCKKLVDIGPPKTETNSELVFSSDQGALSAIRGIYSEMYRTGFTCGTFSSFTVAGGALADEFFSYNSGVNDFYNNNLQPVNAVLRTNYWNHMFQMVYSANFILEKIAVSPGISSAIRTQIEGEAKFIRAFINFYLVNLFGDIPIITSTDYRINAVAERNTVADVYQQIIVDLNNAINLLPGDYLHAGNERVRPNKWAAIALLARVYLYIGNNWQKAEEMASLVISQAPLYSLSSMTPTSNGTFLKNSSEAIWQLMPVQPNANTNEAISFIPSVLTGPPQFVSMTGELLSVFETNDYRKSVWVNNYTVGTTSYYYPYKYKIRLANQPLNEYSMVLRLAEQYLIRAEARAQQNNISGAQADINMIRNRAFGGPNPTSANDKPSLLLAIEKERRIEFFGEWGHRWLDLKRWNKADAVLSALKGSNWQITDKLFPIPQFDLDNNPNLTQNPGY